MLDNFSLIAKWEDVNYANVDQLTFHNNQNNKLVVVFNDSTIALMSLSHESKDGAEHPNSSQEQTGALDIKTEFRMLDEYADMKELRFNVSTNGVETWVCARDITIRNIVTMCSIKQDVFRRLQIKCDDSFIWTFFYHSIPQKALMLVAVFGDYDKPLVTRIWTDLDFDNEIKIESQIELRNRQGFGFSECGSYFLTWDYRDHAENAVEAYDVRLLKTSTNPLARTSIGTDVLRAKGQFIQLHPASLEVLGYMSMEETLIAAILVASSNKMELMLWDVLHDEVFRKLNLIIKEVISVFNVCVKLIHAP